MSHNDVGCYVIITYWCGLLCHHHILV